MVATSGESTLAGAGGGGASPSGRSIELGVTARVTVNPLVVTLALDRTTVSVGESVRARASLTNAGPRTIKDVAVSLRTDSSAFSVRGGRVTVPQLLPGRTTTLSWTLCGQVAGTYLVLVEASTEGVTIESPARVLVVIDQLGRQRHC